MKVVEASAVIPQGPYETWELFFGDQMRWAVELSESVVAVEDYQVRPDGTPRYRMVSKLGPVTMRFTSDYSVYEPPYRAVNRVLDSPFGGTFYATFEPVVGGTRVTWRWEVEPQNALAGLLLPVVRPLLARSIQQGLDAFAKGVASEEDQQRQEEGVSKRRMSLAGGFLLGVGAVVLALYLLLRQRSRASSRR
jgi:hypothetical protein